MWNIYLYDRLVRGGIPQDTLKNEIRHILGLDTVAYTEGQKTRTQKAIDSLVEQAEFTDQRIVESSDLDITIRFVRDDPMVVEDTRVDPAVTYPSVEVAAYALNQRQMVCQRSQTILIRGIKELKTGDANRMRLLVRSSTQPSSLISLQTTHSGNTLTELAYQAKSVLSHSTKY